MEKNLFRYIWAHSRRDQLFVCFVVLLSQPFYFVSLDLPRQIVNQAIQGEAFKDGNVTAPLDRKSTRLNSSHANISYAVFCLKKKKKYQLHHISIHNTYIRMTHPLLSILFTLYCISLYPVPNLFLLPSSYLLNILC